MGDQHSAFSPSLLLFPARPPEKPSHVRVRTAHQDNSLRGVMRSRPGRVEDEQRETSTFHHLGFELDQLVEPGVLLHWI